MNNLNDEMIHTAINYLEKIRKKEIDTISVDTFKGDNNISTFDISIDFFEDKELRGMK